MSRFRSPLLLAAGTFALAAAVTSTPAVAATRSACATKGSVPALSVSAASRARVRGSVLIANGTHGSASLEFCLAAPARSAATLVTLKPAGLTLGLTRGRRLTLTRTSGQHRVRAAAVTLGGRPQVVRLALDGSHKRAALYVAGRRRALTPAPVGASARVYIGATTASSAEVTMVAAKATAAKAASKPVPQAKPAPKPAPAPPATVVATTSGSATVETTGTTTSSTTAPTATTSSASTTSSTSTTTPAPSDILTGAQAAAALPTTNPFSPTSFWNEPLSPTAAIDPNSASYVNDLDSQVNQFGPWMNTTKWSIPVYVVPADQPTVKVTLTTWGPDLQQEFNAVPIPAGALSDDGTDHSMTIWQPSTDKMWDFWLMQQSNGAWSARWGGEMDNVSTNPGYFQHSGQTNNWGGTATGLALLGGLITTADLKRGSINHALALAVPQTKAGVFSWPAQRTDGTSTAATALPEGIRFRLDPNYQIPSSTPGFLKAIEKAAQTYGIVVRDTSGNVTFYAQNTQVLGTNPFAPLFDSYSEATYLSWFPWSHLEALQTQLSG